MQLINTVDEKKIFFTKRQRAEAKKARELFISVGCLSVEYLKAAIRINYIKNNPVTNEAVHWATKIYGLDIGRLKAQMTRRQPNPVVDTSVDITDELLEV